MLQRIKDNPLVAVVFGAFLAWMGWISLASYQAVSIDNINNVLHKRITATKEELVLERNGQNLDLKRQIYDLQEQNRELRHIVLELYVQKCPDKAP